jgi:hypothetical protein
MTAFFVIARGDVMARSTLGGSGLNGRTRPEGTLPRKGTQLDVKP